MSEDVGRLQESISNALEASCFHTDARYSHRANFCANSLISWGDGARSSFRSRLTHWVCSDDATVTRLWIRCLHAGDAFIARATCTHPPHKVEADEVEEEQHGEDDRHHDAAARRAQVGEPRRVLQRITTCRLAAQGVVNAVLEHAVARGMPTPPCPGRWCSG